jgi:hypothetical protein
MFVIENVTRTQLRQKSPENHHHSGEFFASHPKQNLDAKNDEWFQLNKNPSSWWRIVVTYQAKFSENVATQEMFYYI